MQWQRYKDSKKITDEMLFLKIEIKNSRRQFIYVEELMSKHWKMSTWKSLLKSNQNTKFINKLNRFF